MPDATLGMNCKAYYNTGSHGSPVFVEMDNVKDVTLPLELAQADVTTRGNDGWRAKVGTLADATIDFTMQWLPGDGGFDAIKTAFFARSSLELAFMSGPIDETDSEGLRATCSVVKFSRSEPLEEAVTVDVSVTPTLSEFAPEWISGNASY